MPKQKRKRVEKTEPEKSILDKVDKKKSWIIAFAAMAILSAYLFSYSVFSNLAPVGADAVAAKGQTKIYQTWQNSAGETALWNPGIFSGMPIYPRITPKLPHVDTLIGFLGKLIYWGFWYLIVGGLGLFVLLYYKKVPWYLALIAALAFMLLPDWMALIGDGHYSKLRAVMIFPWFLFSFSYFFEKQNWLSVGLFAFVFSWLARTQHIQILFYSLLVSVFLILVPFVKIFIEKNYKQAGALLLKFGIVVALTLLTSAQPIMSLKEYTPYSTRGGNPLTFSEESKSAQETKGVSFEYATQWSFSPIEILDFFIPRATGGLSSEIYDGTDFPQAKGQRVPAYWGGKPFNGNYSSMGAIFFLFAIVGFWLNRKNKFVVGLFVFAIFSIFLSFGRHFPELYKLFYYNIPYFSKFRAPSMILNVTFPSLIIIGGFGLNSLFSKSLSIKDKKFILYTFVGGAAAAVLIYLFKDSFAFTSAREAGRMDANSLNIMKGIRKEFFAADTLRVIFILAAATAAVWAVLEKKIKVQSAVVLLAILTMGELLFVTSRAKGHIQINDEKQLEQYVFRSTPVTEYLTKQKKDYRALALGGEFQSNHYAYFYPTINGYSAIKTQVIQDVIEHSLLKAKTRDDINWSVVNMLGGKYIISPQHLSYPFLSEKARDNRQKAILYENSKALPKAWFVKSVKTFSTHEDIVRFMNSEEFVPDSIALVLESDYEGNSYFTGDGRVEINSITPNEITLSAKTNSEQFLVLSEVYYPEGWEAFINDKPTEIVRTNHILRGIQVPAGQNEISFEFEPQTYFMGVASAWMGVMVIWGLITVFGYFEIKKKQIK